MPDESMSTSPILHAPISSTMTTMSLPLYLAATLMASCFLIGLIAGRASRPVPCEYLVPVGEEVEITAAGKGGVQEKHKVIIPVNKLVNAVDAHIWAEAVAKEQAKNGR